jgi:hypothetical protein
LLRCKSLAENLVKLPSCLLPMSLGRAYAHRQFGCRCSTIGRRLRQLAEDRAKQRWLAMGSIMGSILSGEAKLSPEGEAIAAYGTATMLAFKVLVACLQRNGALERGEFAEALRIFTEGAESEVDRMPLAILHDLRMAMLD